MIKYRQIGNGSAFNTEMTNSSFLIDFQNTENYYEVPNIMLVDCGYNVFIKLRKLEKEENFDLKQINSIYITHLDSDHTGSLRDFLYYQYFINKVTTIVYTSNELYTDLEYYLKDTNYQTIDFRQVKANVFKLKELDTNRLQYWDIITTDTHHYQKGRGILFKYRDSYLYISGDTKASENIKELLEYITEYTNKFKLFHDFSKFDDESRQVHACKTDTERVYGDLRKHITWYHNDEEFNEDWQEI